jgi:hypothetical protein
VGECCHFEPRLQGPSATGTPEPLSADWTALGRPDIDYYDDNGNLLKDRVRLYRLNDKDFAHDWYLIARDPGSQPNYYKSCEGFTVSCGFLTHKRDFQTSINEYASNPGFEAYEWAPKEEIKGTSGEVSIGLDLGGVVRVPGVGVTVPWNQPHVVTVVYSSYSKKEASWVETFEKALTGTNSQPFSSHNAMIVQVPVLTGYGRGKGQ